MNFVSHAKVATLSPRVGRFDHALKKFIRYPHVQIWAKRSKLLFCDGTHRLIKCPHD